MNLFFTDLDDTLFSSLRKHSETGDLQAEAYLKNGDPICYSNPRQRRLRALMSAANTLLIPVTARSVEAFHRAGVRGYHKAICANGAVILDADGNPDRAWERIVRERLQGVQPLLVNFAQACAGWVAQHSLRSWLVTEDGIGPIYCVIKSDHANAAVLATQAAKLRAAPPPWVGTVHHNDNNLAIIPSGVSKTLAVARLRASLRASHPRCVAFGVGDSRSDWSFMSLCDFALMPTESQLARNIGQRLADLETC